MLQVDMTIALHSVGNFLSSKFMLRRACFVVDIVYPEYRA